MTREEAKAGINVTKYGMSYSDEGNGSFSGHEDFIDKIYDDFESRECISCKYCDNFEHSTNLQCNNVENSQRGVPLEIESYFGCNKWEAKDAK